MCFVVLQGMGTVLRAIILVMVSNLLCTPVVQLDPISTDISAFTFLLFIILYLPSWFYPQNYPDHVWPVERWRRFGSSRFWRNSSCVQLRKLRKLPNTVFFKFRAKQCCVLCCPVRAWDISVVTKRSSRSPVSLSSVQTQFCSCFWSVHSQVTQGDYGCTSWSVVTLRLFLGCPPCQSLSECRFPQLALSSTAILAAVPAALLCTPCK